MIIYILLLRGLPRLGPELRYLLRRACSDDFRSPVYSNDTIVQTKQRRSATDLSSSVFVTASYELSSISEHFLTFRLLSTEGMFAFIDNVSAPRYTLLRNVRP